MAFSDTLAPVNTTRLVLRPPVIADLETLFELYADPICNRFSAMGPPPSRESSMALLMTWIEHWQTSGFGYWAIADREHPEVLLGFGGVMNRTIEGVTNLYLYFRFRSQAWGLGLASEMAMQALEMAFQTLHQANVLAVVMPANRPSRKTLERIGMLLKGSLADVPGQPPVLVYELTAARFVTLPKTQPAPTLFGA